MAGRKRGNVSHPCPLCKSNSRVIETRRAKNARTVTRLRECLNPSCGNRFVTHETPRHRQVGMGVSLSAVGE
jgi:transcriptional regulator NrdR family protein